MYKVETSIQYPSSYTRLHSKNVKYPFPNFENMPYAIITDIAFEIIISEFIFKFIIYYF